MYLLTVLIATILLVHGVVSEDEEDSELGRIKAFDDVLLMYAEFLSETKELKYAIQEAKRLARNPNYNPEYTQYYIEILERLQSEGVNVLQKENRRLDVIITSVSNQRGAESELEYAQSRKRIIGSFTDAIAGHMMNSMRHDKFPGEFEL